MFGIDFGAPELCSVSGGFLQQGLGLFADTAGEPTAATARGARTGRGGFAERGIDDLVGIGRHGRCVVTDAEEVAAKEVFEQPAARAEQGFQR